MPLQILFNDDEHTASEGAYARLMKTRKWVYISSVLATALSLRLYDANAAALLFPVIKLPAHVLASGLLLGLIYMVIQFGLISFQLWRTYDLVLGSRLADRQEAKAVSMRDEIAAVEDELRSKHQEKAHAFNQLANAADDVKATEAALQEWEATAPDDIAHAIAGSLKGEGYEVSRRRHQMRGDSVTRAQAAARENYQALMAQHPGLWPPSLADAADPVLASLSHSRDRLAARLKDLEREDPAKRPGYRTAEIAVDMLRLAPPVLFAIAAGINLAIAMAAP